ncbi:MAG: pantetheine-phosphate adenylyltransferase [Oscillospiraceae bacterium]|nr:pantetheine-phosphate adenylyltransferase [Oscillospiraceae bacterium]
MAIAICPGSFDPITNGHLNIIERTAKLFDEVIVLVLKNPTKVPLFTDEERVDMIRSCTRYLPNVKVDAYSGLLADYAHQVKADALVKGLRAVTDFEYEFQMSLINKKLNPLLETMFLNTDSEYMYLSSSIVKQVGEGGGSIADFVPAAVREQIEKRIKENI